MTLTEYINQPEPAKLNSGEVVLQDSEIQIIATMRPKFKTAYTRVYLEAFGIGYVILEGSDVLRTTDSDGNVKGYSVFSYKIPKEKLTQNCLVKSK
jgi:hypothetical protein